MVPLDDTSTANLTLDQDATVKHLYVRSGYSGTITASSTISATTTNLFIHGGTFDLNGATLNVTGNLTVGDAATFRLQGGETLSASTTSLSATSTVVFKGDGDGSSDTFTITDYFTDYGNLQINSTDAADVFQMGAALSVAQNLTLTQGIFDLNGSNLTVTGTLTVAENATLRLQGGETLDIGTLDLQGGSTVIFTGDGEGTTFTITDFAAAYENLEVNGSPGTFQLGAPLTVNGAFALKGGTYNANAASTTVTGLTTVEGGTYQASTATQTSNGGLTISGGTFTGSSGDLTIQGDLTLSGGAFTASFGTTKVSGDWNRTGGEFEHNDGTVQFNSDHTITGNNTFHNLTKTTDTASTLTFEAGSTQTIENTLTLKGASGNLLSLRSTVDGTQWKIDPQGDRDIEFLEVQDSNNLNATAMDCVNKNCTDSGNNTNWVFLAALPDEDDTPAPAQLPSQNVAGQVQNLISMGNYEAALQLMNQWPHLFPDGQQQILLYQIKELQLQVIQLMERLVGLLQQQLSAAATAPPQL